MVGNRRASAGKGDPQLDPGQLGADAAVDAVAESQVRVAGRVGVELLQVAAEPCRPARHPGPPPTARPEPARRPGSAARRSPPRCGRIAGTRPAPRSDNAAVPRPRRCTVCSSAAPSAAKYSGLCSSASAPRDKELAVVSCPPVSRPSARPASSRSLMSSPCSRISMPSRPSPGLARSFDHQTLQVVQRRSDDVQRRIVAKVEPGDAQRLEAVAVGVGHAEQLADHQRRDRQRERSAPGPPAARPARSHRAARRRSPRSAASAASAGAW